MEASAFAGVTRRQWPWDIHKRPLVTLVNSTASSCDGEKHLTEVLSASLYISAAVFIVLFSCFQLCGHLKFSLSCLQHLITVPVDMFGITPHRFIYCVILCTLSADIFKDTLDSSLYYRSNNGVLDAFLFFVHSPSIIILRQMFFYMPVLLCVDSYCPTLGHILGCLYTLLMGGRSVYAESVILRGCSYRGQLGYRDAAISVGVVLPAYIGYVLTVCWFFCSTVVEVTGFLFAKQQQLRNLPRCKKDTTYAVHVRHLLKSHSFPPQVRPPLYYNLADLVHQQVYYKQPVYKIELWNIFARGIRYVLPWKSNSHVRFPLAFLAAICMAFVIMYQVTVVLLSKELIALHNALNFVNRFNVTIKLLEFVFPNETNTLENILYDVNSSILSLQVLCPLAHWVGWWVTVFITIYMIQSFHKYMSRCSHGDISFLLASEPLPSSAYQLAAAMRYIPFQIGHMLFSYILFSLMLLCLGVFGLMYYLAFKNFTYYGIHYWCLFMVPYMWAFFLHTLQLSLARYVFLKKTGSKYENELVVGIRFRHAYLLLTYVFLFFNVIYALAMCFLRVFGALVFNITMLFRLDRDIYMRGLEGWDLGHRTFVGYCYLECTTNNPILRTFINILLQAVGRSHKKKKWAWLNGDTATRVYHTRSPINQDTGDNISTSSNSTNAPGYMEKVPSSSLPLCSKRARNRWFVAYTLLRNPALLPLTSSNIIERNS